jgi:hypothetical protein
LLNGRAQQIKAQGMATHGRPDGAKEVFGTRRFGSRNAR